jgi:hypothetical protein
MDEDNEHKARALPQVLEVRCPDEKFSDDDIKKLMEVGFVTESSLRKALPEDFKAMLPRLIGVVAILRSAFLKPAGMFPYQGFAMLTLMLFMDLYATDL